MCLNYCGIYGKQCRSRSDTKECRAGLGAQLDAHLTGDQEVLGLNTAAWHYSFMETDHEIFSVVILSLPLIQEVHLLVSGKRMCTILVNCLED